MTASEPLIIDAVCGESERPVFAAACIQLGRCLGGGGTPGDWPIRLRLHDSISSLDADGKPAVILLSLIGEVARDEPIEQTKARWQTLLSHLAENSVAQIFLCTIFRHVANGGSRQGHDTQKTMERIRRLNLMAAHLSHDLGINVIDIDRSLAHIGARALGTDYRLAGRAAAEVAGCAIMMGLLDVGLDDAIAADVLGRAREHHRGSGGIMRVPASSL